MERFVVSKYLRPIVLSGLATSLLIGVLSAPAWATSTDKIANTSPSVSPTSGGLQISLNESLSQAILSNPKVHDWIMQQILSDPKVHDQIIQYLKDKHNLKSNISLAVPPNGPSMPVGAPNGPNMPVGAPNTPSTPVGALNKPSTPENGHNQSNALGRVRYPRISEYEQDLSRYEQDLSSILDVALSIPNPDVAGYAD